MSILTAHQREVVRADTRINEFIIDYVCNAFDALVDRDDVDDFRRWMARAVVQLGFAPKEEDRPSAIDKIYLICVAALADKKGWTRPRTLKWIKDAVEAK